MTTQDISRVHATELPQGAVPVRAGGLLSGVRRPCPEHGADCACVARSCDGQLVFWCGEGEHHVTARS